MQDYLIILQNEPEELAEAVNNRINQGYTPIGGVAVINYGDGEQFMQAMLYSPKKDEV